ncbi:murein biosynthesis integral membrane protein MurJ [Aeromicrobium wangtongii]|uniref:Murein biosynthesis integral membrane protein MurJ n=1 Tax=Aeromicrobium wangtongii TaxID=2969247 RepID=A0ABY5M9U4_9ACTN|nr:murein biosynthesis integral membrane protein MurJ [Aeromicrobium wangtongii]MCD9199367.1 murein biosynthesis integral membrane protein MurJ [Aeromicrobium wangtongii]UUP13724.1 murein biosynthesis integral membrane protein MurJ [Aeromicrobium wangtongii]
MTESTDSTQQTVARASAWMALGTIVSRITGFLRAGLLALVIGTQLNGDLFDIANTIPNTLYILLAGGIFNVVLVPQLVRAMKNDPDGGDAYANRVITLGVLVLGVGTLLLMVLTPLLLRIVFDPQLFESELSAQRDSAHLLMLLCLPQVFFYGVFVLVGQILNARKRFGPMMWAPIVNNVVACCVVIAYAFIFGTSNGVDGFTTTEAVLLGAGSTLAIVLQALVLVPFLRRAGFRYRPRFDFRGVGLGHTMRLAVWTLMFIVVNQIAFIVINRLATGATLGGATDGEKGAGSTVYGLGYLISQLPHGVITVSLATAILPTLAALAAERRYDRFRLELGRTVRIALVIVVPIAVALACLGQPAAAIAGGFGALGGSTMAIGYTIQAFALASVTFTIHYMMLRGFYANEDNRTPLFIQLVIAAVNIAVAVVLVQLVDPNRVAMMLALAYGIAYLIGAFLSVTLLSRAIGPIVDREMRFFIRRMTVAVLLTAFVTLGVANGLDAAGVEPARALGGLITTLVAGLAGAVTYVAASRVVGLKELDHLVRSLLRRG